MKKVGIAGILLMACLCLAGCGSQGRGQEAKAQGAEHGLQDVQGASQELHASQTAWDGSADFPGEDADKNSESIAEIGGKYKAEFLGVDSAEILSCKVFHGESQEEIAPASARGKYLLEMLSGFFENPQYEYGFALGIVDLEEESLEEMAEKRGSDYFILIQSGQDMSLSFMEPWDRFLKHKNKLSNFDTAIVEVSGAEGLFLNYNVDDKGLFHPLGCQSSEVAADFQKKWGDWEKIEDWDAALANLEEEKQEISEQSAKIWGNLNGAGQKREGQADFLGIDTAQIQLCRVYHGESLEELNLAEDRGKEFLQRLAAFLEKQEYSDTYCQGGLEDEEVLPKDIGDMAKRQGENYYVLLQFSQPVSVYLKEKKEGAFWVHDVDTLAVEVDRDEKILNLNWHNQKELPNDGFFSCIGVHKKKAVKGFSEMYEEWDSLF